ncbi:MAG TPA: flagellar biosynthesis anti-sigma factor FlgM [Chloroflexota bacterium]|jgi:negative regulator of flagellin synthesis FlgM|nr:flagellar biosynthesis anti-sigma factor FlgM [Chloroflexota bacterium]
MTSIDRISSDAARTYAQQSDAARTTAAGAYQASKPQTSPTSATNRDSVTLSDGARSLASARAAVESAPDVRHQKVADIKQQVDSGTYSVSARVLARNMVDHSQNPS